MAKQIPPRNDDGPSGAGGTEPTARKDKYKSMLIGVAIVIAVAIVLSVL